jgi:hypothetical protein
MKRARSEGTDEDQQAERTKIRATVANTNVLQDPTDSCFFFVKLLDGSNISAGKCSRPCSQAHGHEYLECAV